MMIITIMMVIIVCLKGDGAMAESQSLEQFKGQIRLPKFVVPIHYEIFLKPDLEAFKFAGTVEITIDVLEDTQFLVLNVAKLAMMNESISFQGHGASLKLQPLEIMTIEEDEILVLRFNHVLPHGEGILRMGFDGILNDQTQGFYKSENEYNGEKKMMAVTNFEPTDARRCFPCWDEPALKATFTMTLEVPLDQVALSNMPVAKQEIHGNMKKLFYQESPIMSTYLVAVVVGMFDFLEAYTIDGIKVRVYCQFGKTSHAKFALDVAVKTLNLFKEYFEVPYPLPKLDMIAIPNFDDAMENFGLVIFTETALLYDEIHSSATAKPFVAYYVTHELSHQWFGNLVTMEWWTYLWLNEGFATWLSYLAQDSLFPEWKIWTQFLDSTTSGLNADALEESHPIEVDKKHELNAYFDDITYEKGASLIQMLQSFIGAKTFKKSLVTYVKRFTFSSVMSEDLWNVIEEESSVQIKMMMNSWTKQKGYPLVHVTLRDGNFELEQSHFLANGSVGVGEWIVPITMGCGSYGTTKEFLLKTKFKKINASQLVDSLVYDNNGKKGQCLWTKFNVNQTGFYRVIYDDELEIGIRYAIKNNKLSAMDRYGNLNINTLSPFIIVFIINFSNAGILDDSFTLCVASMKNFSSLLSLMIAYREEPEYTIISLLIQVSYRVNTVITISNPELSNNITKILISLFKHSAERLGWDPKEGESIMDTTLRGKILTALIVLGDSITRNEGLKHFNTFLNDRNTSLLHFETRTAIYDAGMLAVNKTNRYGFDSLLQIYKETVQREEKTGILRCLASSLDPDIILEALNFFLSAEVNAEDVTYGFEGLKIEGREVAWKWFKENWDYISKAWGPSAYQVSNFASNIINMFSSEEKAEEIIAFFGRKVTPEFSEALKLASEGARITSNWGRSITDENLLADFIELLLKE